MKAVAFLSALCISLSLAFLNCATYAQPESGQTVRADVWNQPELPSFRFALEEVKPRVFEGGKALESTVDNFPASQNIAGVSMYLKPGGLRELHWHANAAEWAYVIKGHCRVTVFDPEARWEVKDFGPGDVWYFPRGHGHSIQGIGDEECHFILVFDNGRFSEFATFSITDWIAHIPPEVLAKNFRSNPDVFRNFPKKEVYIAQGPVPPPLPSDLAAFSQKAPSLTHKYSLGAQRGEIFDGGTFQMVSRKQFPISTTMTGAVQTLKPRALRELHWHPNADEWQYYISGHTRVSIFGATGRSRTEEFGPGDVAYIPRGYGHYIENTSNSEDSKTLIVLDSGDYQEISLSEWMASNPTDLLQTNFGVPKTVFQAFPRANPLITGK